MTVWVRFTNLHVWQQARTLLQLVSAATRDMRAEGDLKSQMRRAAISVVSNISEGSERGSDREFRRFLAIANASAAEVEAQAIIASDIDCLDPRISQQIAEQCRFVGRMINGLMARLDASG
jgi:four helix bundle protein